MSFETDSYVHNLFVTRHDIITSLTFSDVQFFLNSLHIAPLIVDEAKQIIICPTVCHNALTEPASQKLYWYQNYKLFHCYTDCGKNMTIFEFYQKFMSLNYGPVSDEDTNLYISKCIKHLAINEYKPLKETINFDKYKFDKTIPELKEYSPNVLDNFVKYYHPQWLHEGITREAMDNFNIRFSLLQNAIIIPHYDIKSRLIGIRGRFFEEQDLLYGKYHPITVGDTTYNHMLGYNLYGIHLNAHAIKMRHSAIIVEGEKSVLLDAGYHPEISNVVAICGSSLNKYQVSLLTDILGVNEIILALDKEYVSCYDNKGKQYQKHLYDICKKYSNQASFSYIWDYENLLNEKDAPLDRGKDVFDYLYKNRIKVL